MKLALLITIVVAATALLFAYTQLTIFIVDPIGVVPQGATVLMWRTEKLRFIDSADSVCEREMGGVNLLCRAAVLAGVGQSDARLARFPYSDRLYLISTGGKRYER